MTESKLTYVQADKKPNSASNLHEWTLREELEGRPALSAVLGLIVGMTAFAHPANLVFLTALVWFRSPTARVLGFAFCVLGICVTFHSPQPLRTRTKLDGVGVIESQPYTSLHGSSTTVLINGRRLLLTVSSNVRLRRGDSVWVDAIAQPMYDSASTGLCGRMFVGGSGLRVLSHGNLLSQAGNFVRDEFRAFLQGATDRQAAALIEAAWFGSEELDPALRNRLDKSGAASIVAASGLQVFLITSVVMRLLSVLPITRIAQIGVTVVVALVYLNACSQHPGAERALLVWLLGSSVYVFRRHPDLLSAIAWSAVIELIWRPDWLASLGFQLSFVVATALVLCLPKVQVKDKSLERTVRLAMIYVGASACATLAAYPLIAYQVGLINLQSPLTTFLVMPLIPVIDIGSGACWLVSLLNADAGGEALRLTVAPLAHLSMSIAQWGAEGPTVDILGFGSYWLVVYYGLLVAQTRPSARAFQGRSD